MEPQLSINLINITNREKHNLKGAECIIGRGWLNCNDKRISHKHGIIKIKSCAAIDLLSTHDNPIFYKKQSDGILSLLQKGNKIELFIGDLFGLTPDAFWFRIEKYNDETANTPSNAANIETNGLVSNETTIQIKVERNNDDEPNTVDGELTSLANRPIKPEPMDTSQAAADVNHSNGQTSDSQIPISTEIKEEERETETSPNQNEVAGTSDPNAQIRVRECCKYGIRCYRRNLIHRIEQAHPGDTDYRMPDYGEPPYGVPSCSFGQRCYRRNPLHFKQFSHSHEGQTKQGTQRAKRNRPNDDKTDKTNTKRRKPKTNDENDDGKSSMDDEDPYATDEDSEFSLNEDPSDSESSMADDTHSD